MLEIPDIGVAALFMTQKYLDDRHLMLMQRKVGEKL